MTMTKLLRITSRREGFRRAGIAHPARPTDHPLDGFTEAQIEVLKGEPMLIVEEVETAGEADDKAATPAKGQRRQRQTAKTEN